MLRLSALTALHSALIGGLSTEASSSPRVAAIILGVGGALSRILVAELDLGPIQTQFAVRIADGRTVWCDMRVGCHVIEFDGKIKITPVELGGVATQPAEQVLWKERKRQHEVCAVGLGMSRLTWGDLFGPARERAKARLRAEESVTRARFGAVLPAHLAEFAATHPRAGGVGKLWLPPTHDTA